MPVAGGGVMHDDNDNADMTPQGRPHFVALGLKIALPKRVSDNSRGPAFQFVKNA